jgi:hypothetical protein
VIVDADGDLLGGLRVGVVGLVEIGVVDPGGLHAPSRRGLQQLKPGRHVRRAVSVAEDDLVDGDRVEDRLDVGVGQRHLLAVHQPRLGHATGAGDPLTPGDGELADHDSTVAHSSRTSILARLW